MPLANVRRIKHDFLDARSSTPAFYTLDRSASRRQPIGFAGWWCIHLSGALTLHTTQYHKWASDSHLGRNLCLFGRRADVVARVPSQLLPRETISEPTRLVFVLQHRTPMQSFA